jgi:hypothetical protein
MHLKIAIQEKQISTLQQGAPCVLGEVDLITISYSLQLMGKIIVRLK